jgi:hypothetical protein
MESTFDLMGGQPLPLSDALDYPFPCTAQSQMSVDLHRRPPHRFGSRGMTPNPKLKRNFVDAQIFF